MKIGDAHEVIQMEHKLGRLLVAQAWFADTHPARAGGGGNVSVMMPDIAPNTYVWVGGDAAEQVRLLALQSLDEQIGEMRSRLKALGVDTEGWLPQELRPVPDALRAFTSGVP